MTLRDDRWPFAGRAARVAVLRSLSCAWVGVEASWVAVVVGSGLAACLGVICLAHLACRRPRLGLCALLASPLAVLPLYGALVLGLGGYVSGTARLWTNDALVCTDLDPQTRCYWSSDTGLHGLESLVHAPSNWVVRRASALFGPMPGAYAGPIPTADEALMRLKSSGTPVDPSRFMQGGLAGGHLPVPLPRTLREAAAPLSTLIVQVIVARVGEGCLLVGSDYGDPPAPEWSVPWEWALLPHGLHVVVIDTGGARVIASYCFRSPTVRSSGTRRRWLVPAELEEQRERVPGEID